MTCVPTDRSGLAKAQTRATLVSFNQSMMYRGVFDIICGGTTFIFVAFALSVGIARENIGLVAVAVSLACILQMLALPLISRIVDRKQFVVKLGISEACIMIAMVLLVPLLPAALRLPGLAVAAFTAAACLHLARPVTDDWVATIIPAGLRGKYLGRRFQLLSAVLILAAPAVGLLATITAQDDTLGLSLILCVGGLFGVLAALALRSATMPQLAMTTRATLADLPRTWRVPDYRKYLIGVLMINTPFFFVVPFYHVFNLTVAGMTTFHIGCIAGLYGLMRVLSAPIAGQYVNRIGPRRMVMCTCPTYFAIFAMYTFTPAGVTWPLFMVWAVAGLADGCYGVASQTALLAVVPTRGARPAFFAMFNLITLGLFAIGGALAVPLLKALEHVVFHIGPWKFDQFHIFYGLAMLVMIPASLGALGMPVKVGRTTSRLPKGGPQIVAM